MRMLAKLAVLCLAPIALTAQADLTGAGATVPFPNYSKWFADYAKTGVKIRPGLRGTPAPSSQIAIDRAGVTRPLHALAPPDRDA